MHQISFEFKRGHLRTVAWGEAAMASVPGMTAARFDLLCLIRQKAIFEGRDDPRSMLAMGLTQKKIWSLLDLSKTTISIMLKRLERIEWVHRGRGSGKEWRTKVVRLTPKGLFSIAKAMRIMFRQRTMLKYIEDVFKKAPAHKRTHVVKAIHGVWEHINFVARIFGDRAAIAYDMGDIIEGWPSELSTREPCPRHPFYAPPPRAKRPPKPLRGAARDPSGRPFEFTAYENAVRAIVWGTEKKRRLRRPDRPSGA
jgi:DNA-binding MarR family transcriptional regulator